MKIVIVTPESPETTLGNSITAIRWSGILQSLGHQTVIAQDWTTGEFDVLVALHARRSHASAERFHRAHPDKPLIVALTGTDLYRDLPGNSDARHSLSIATRIIALQSGALDALDEARGKTHVIYQSATPPDHRERPREDCFEVSILSHLREVKDPLRAAFASQLLPASSRIRITHAGRPLEPDCEAQARAEANTNPRYQWLGEQPHDVAMQLLARSRATVVSSMMEGGASAIAEAVVCGVPVLCSDIPGNIGMLSPDYPGYFRLKDTKHLAQMLHRTETDSGFRHQLEEFVRLLQPRFSRENERAAWRSLLATIQPLI